MCYKINNNMKRLLAAGLVCASVAALRADTSADAFLKMLQRALESGDRRAVTAVVSYPLTVLAGGMTIPVKDAAALTAMYDAVFTPTLACAIAQTGTAGPGHPSPKHPLVSSGDQLSLAGGLVTARLVNGAFRIGRIAVPPNVVRAAAPRSVQRVMFRGRTSGPRSAPFAGRLSGGATDAYVIALARGETVEARIEGFAGNGAAVRIAQAGQPAATPAQGGRIARHAATAAGDYRIEVVRLASRCAPGITYRLTVAVR